MTMLDTFIKAIEMIGGLFVFLGSLGVMVVIAIIRGNRRSW